MKNAIKFIAITILISISILAVNAQEQTIVTATDDSSTTEKVEKKSESAKKRQSNSDDDSWTGFYVGGYVGNSNNRAAANTSADSGSGYFNTTSIPVIGSVGTQKLKSNGLSGGGSFGYNKQSGRFFVGGEVDFGSQNSSQSATGSATYPCCAPTNFTITQSVESNWIITTRPRAGIATKKALIYATGGVAITNIKYAEKFTDTFADVTQSGGFSKSKTGWTAGGGIEFKVSGRWSVKGEYLFSQFSRNSITSNNLTQGDGFPYTARVFTHSTDLKSHSVRFGVNYRF